jgi:hypothetical protein
MIKKKYKIIGMIVFGLLVAVCVICTTLLINRIEEDSFELLPCSDIMISTLDDGSLIVAGVIIENGKRKDIIKTVYDVRDIDYFFKDRLTFKVKRYKEAEHLDELVIVYNEPKKSKKQ